jgi:hypothetical protein
MAAQRFTQSEFDRTRQAGDDASRLSGAVAIFFKVAFEMLEAADALAVDEDLRRGLDIVTGLELVDLFARAEDPVVDLIPLGLQPFLRGNALGAGVIGKDHSIQRGLGGHVESSMQPGRS